MNRNVFLSIALLFLFPIFLSQAIYAQRNFYYSDNQNESQILSLINRERSKFGLDQLGWNQSLADLARRYSEKMAREHFFEHIDSDGNDVVERARQSRIRGWSKIGENRPVTRQKSCQETNFTLMAYSRERSRAATAQEKSIRA